MEIKRAVMEVKLLEDDILKQLIKLQDHTGLRVKGIGIDIIETTSMSGEYDQMFGSVKIEVTI